VVLKDSILAVVPSFSTAKMRKKIAPIRIYVVYLQCDAASSSPRLCAGDESGFSFL
jgi:hypothetical protein